MIGYTVSEVARRVGARPRDISDLFYGRKLSDERCPIIGGKRIIPPEYVPVIAEALRKHNLISAALAGGTVSKELMWSIDVVDHGFKERANPASVNEVKGECDESEQHHDLVRG